MRLLDKSRSRRSASAQLGMPAETYKHVRRSWCTPRSAWSICAGPTGAGKTTTLYATLLEINSTGKNVTTIEDPVEYVFPGINQMQTNDAAGLTFATGLKALLRQDPDVILVGEIRDADTARIAVQSALTGHFVLSSLHGTDSVAALHRLLDMGIEAFLVASAVVAVVGAAPGAPDLRQLQGAVHARRRGAGGVPAALRRQRQDRLLPRRGLQLLRQHRLPRPHRRLRAAPDHARAPPPDRRLGDHRGTAPSGGCQGMRTMLRGGDAARRRRRHDDPRGRPHLALAN